MGEVEEEDPQALRRAPLQRGGIVERDPGEVGERRPVAVPAQVRLDAPGRFGIGVEARDALAVESDRNDALPGEQIGRLRNRRRAGDSGGLCEPGRRVYAVVGGVVVTLGYRAWQ